MFQDIRYPLRALKSSPGFTIVAILSLALGIGANTAIFSLIDAVMLRSLPVEHPETLLSVNMADHGPSYTNPIWENLRDRQDVFDGIFAYNSARFNLAPAGQVRYAEGSWVSGDYFRTLGIRAILGRTITPADDRRGCEGTAVIGYDFWQREFGGAAGVLDRPLSLQGKPFRIIGVIEAGFNGVEVGSPSAIFVPLCAQDIVSNPSPLDKRSWWWLRVVGRPKAGLGQPQVLARLKTIAPQVFEATVPPQWRADMQANYRKRTFSLEPAGSGISPLRRQYTTALVTLMVIVGVVLLIACANVANLLLARSAARRKEIAIRLALGSGRARLVRQLLTESLILSLGGAALGLMFAQWGSRLVVGFLSRGDYQVFLNLTPDARVFGFTTAVAVATGLLFGLAPAWRGTRVEPQVAMKENARGVVDGRSRFSLGKVLVALQVALSMVLLAGAGLLLNTFRTLATLDPGFRPDRILITSVDLRNAKFPKERLGAAYSEMLDRLRAIPGVESASSSVLTPIGGASWNDTLTVEGFQPKDEDDATVWFNRVSGSFFETLGTKLIAGRDFTAADRDGSQLVAVINQATARHFFGNANPVGRTIRYGFLKPGPPVEIVGVAADAKYNDLREASQPVVYLAIAQDRADEVLGSSLNFEIRSAGPATGLIAPATEAILAVNRDISIKFRSMSVQVAESLNRERLLATLSGFFGGLALLLATIGLYGVMSYSVARRRGEIGIRMALGAGAQRVLGMVLSEVALVIGVGVIAGIGAAIASTRLLESFLYGLKPRDPWTLALAAAVLIAVALFAGYLPARRASRLDPMVALREE